MAINITGLGNANGIGFKSKVSGGGSGYLPPELKDSIVGLWKLDQNTNESPTRNIIKNTIKGKGGDLELLNFGYKLNSGYGKYEVDFTDWSQNSSVVNNRTSSMFNASNNTPSSTSALYQRLAAATNPFKIQIKGIKGDVSFRYYINENDVLKEARFLLKEGINELPASLDPTSVSGRVGFIFHSNSTATIIQIPQHEGALVTDGKDDMIVSQKTVQEMGITNEITVVSMIHQIGIRSEYNGAFNNYIRNQNVGFIRNNIAEVGIDKTGIYGYTWNNSTKSVINNILGDKNDYSIEVGNSDSIEGKFTVEGYINNGSPDEISEVAVYWTFIANKVLTTDEINQIIAYFKLDKYVTPQIIYDVKRQGLTNDTPAADWYLKDFSKNGFDMSLFNFAKKLGSGVGKYEVDFNSWIPQYNVGTSTYTSNKLHVTDIKNGNAILYTRKATSVMKVKVTGIQSLDLVYRYITGDDTWGKFKFDGDGIYELPAGGTTTKTYYTGFSVLNYIGDCDITIEQIPDYEGALVSDGKDDYGKAEGLPILKDYTVASKYSRFESTPSYLLSKATQGNDGAFIFNDMSSSYSFGTSSEIDTHTLFSTVLRYQSKYINQGKSINAGSGIDTDSLWLSIIRDNDTRLFAGAFYSMLLFPYSLSEFLLERQLKRYKLGTLYPDMVEWRPIYTSNVNDYTIIKATYFDETGQHDSALGNHYPIGTRFRIYVKPSGAVDEVTSIKVNGVELIYNYIDSNYGYAFNGTLSSKSPQKIDITIDEYIRYEDIVQPYPAIINLKQDGKTITWGDKLKVGSEVTFVNHTNLLPDLYTVSGGVQYNGTSISWNTSIRVEKSMVFVNPHSYKKANEPNCILAPQTLRIPNSSYKILGYIPDLTGKGNHGRLNNFAYTEESGANEDGSIRFDGTDDHIIIPTIKHGGKALLMKVNWRYKNRIAMVYDQRINWFGLGISISQDQLPLVAYKPYNKVIYIDGIKNESVLVQDLEGITHNITGIYDNLDLSDKRDVCISRTSDASNSGFADMSMYEFMLFPDVPNEEEIKELNDVMGIEGGYVESPDYYWDAYGKKNTDADRNLIADQVSKDVANALQVKNVGYNSESGYTDDNGLLLDGVDDHAVNTVIPAVTDFTVIAKREFPESALVNNQTFLVKGNAINENNNVNSLVMECYWSDNYVISFQHQNVIPLEESKISWATPTSYNGNVITKGSGVDSAGLAIGRLRELYRKVVFYKLMFYTKTIDQLSINMLKNLFERDELIDVTNPIFKKQ